MLSRQTSLRLDEPTIAALRALAREASIAKNTDFTWADVGRSLVTEGIRRLRRQAPRKRGPK